MAVDGPGPDDARDVLNGWKEIAGYLGKSVRTAQRWERELGLPTHRIKTADAQIVYAKRQEIETWLARMESDVTQAGKLAASTAEPPRTYRRWAWLGAALPLIAAAAWAFVSLGSRSEPPHPKKFQVVGRDLLQALDANGRVVWSRRFPSEVSLAEQRSVAVTAADVDGDEANEFLVPIRYAPADHSDQKQSDGLFAFTSTGHLLWSVTSDRVVSCGGHTYSSPWIITALYAFNDTKPARVWIAFSHRIWWPSFVVEVQPGGVQVPRYLQAGWINSVTEWKTPSGTWGVAGGVMNEEGRPSVTRFDPDRSETFMQSKDAQFECAPNAASPQPERVILFPNFEVRQVMGGPYDMVTKVRQLGSDLSVEIDEADVVGLMTPDGTVRDLASGDSYWFLHRRLEEEKRLTHSAKTCPDVVKPKDVREWTPADGWRSSPMMLQVRQAVSRRP